MIGFIGGSGLYQMDELEEREEKLVETPFGPPSSVLTLGSWEGVRVAFLPRHGKNHERLPGEINYRANIWAMKAIGVTQIVGVSAVGSLREEIAPGQMVIVDQYFDWTKGKRESTFFGKGIVAHVSTAQPTCSFLSRRLFELSQLRAGKTYACVEGPRFGTKVESRFLRSAGCDVVGMTNLPEAFLAREAQICYSAIAIATDYDCWMEDTDRHPSVAEMLSLYRANVKKVQQILRALALDSTASTSCACRQSLSGSILTPREHWTSDQAAVLEVLLR